LSLKDCEKLLNKREKEILQDLILQAVVGIEDPVREQVRLKLAFQVPAWLNETSFFSLLPLLPPLNFGDQFYLEG